MNVLYFYLFLLVHPYLAMWWKSFEQAGRPTWEALIPGYNYFIAFKLGTQKPFWTLLLIFPGVHLVMWSVVNLSYIRRFGYFSLIDTIQGIFFPYIILYKIATSGDKILPETNWANSVEIGKREWGDHLVLFLALPVIGHVIALGINAVTRDKPGKKTKVKEWGDSIWFALVAALVIRTYVFEPFKIPTGSMENTLLVGDFLFVNKVAYGPKVPVTPVSYPLVHNTVPWINVKSYIGIETSNYTRVPGYSKVNRNDVVVFNYPAGDTAIYDPKMPTGLMGHNYHEYVNKEAFRMWLEESNYANNIRRELSKQQRYTSDQLMRESQRVIMAGDMKDFFSNLSSWKNKAREFIASGKTYIQTQEGPFLVEHYGIIPRPVDKRENYIKRCVGIPGDYLEIIDAQLYVNGKKAKSFENQLFRYEAYDFSLGDPERAWERYGIDIPAGQYNRGGITVQGDTIPAMVFVNNSGLKKLKTDFPNVKFEPYLEDQYSDIDSIVPTGGDRYENLLHFPNDPNVNNTVSDFHKFWVPKKGATITLTEENIPYYRRIISVYEGHSLVEKDGKYIIDGKATTKYTFEMNYYWMMGDNRYNSADSRMWGFVPEDHIVGKASMVWMSSGNDGIRWDRVFKGIE